MSRDVLLAFRFETHDRAPAFRERFRGRRVHTLQDLPDDLSNIAYAVVWNPPRGLLASLPNLEIMFSLGAGVDHVVAQPDLPDVPLVRFVDPDLSGRMAEWVTLHCLLHLRRQHDLDAQQRDRVWREPPVPAAHQVRVGIMGFGTIGQACAKPLRALGFSVAGWSRSRKRVEGVESFTEPELDAFLARTDILVSLLPATADTKGILNASLFARLARDGPLGGPVLLNAGRGSSQDETDLAAALRNGTLAGASLDVFETEPLDTSSDLWHAPNCYVSPHMAAVSDPQAFVRNVAAQIERHERGEPLLHVVDRSRGY